MPSFSEYYWAGRRGHLIGVGGVVAYQAYRLKQIRLEKHQTGKDVSE